MDAGSRWDALVRLGAPVCGRCNTFAPGGGFASVTELRDDGGAFRWDSVCARCVQSIADRNRQVREHQQRVEELVRHQDRLRREAEQRRLAMRTMEDVLASNRSNSQSYAEAVRAHQHEIDAAQQEWGIGDGLFGGDLFGGAASAPGPRRRRAPQR